MKLFNELLAFFTPLAQEWGYFIIFIFAAVETFPLVGIFIPGGTLVAIGGFFAKIHILNFGTVVAVGAAGAIVGDFIGYQLGVLYGYNFLLKYGKYFLFKPDYFEKTRKFVFANPGKSLIVGRFHALTRVFAPFLAGASSVPLGTFSYYNIIGGISWALVNVLLGYAFGQSYERISKYIGVAFILALLLSFSIIHIYRFLEARRHIFNRRYLIVLIANIASLYGFVKIMESVLWGSAFRGIDKGVADSIGLASNTTIIGLMSAISVLFDPLTLACATFVLVIALLYRKKWELMLFALVAVLGTFISGQILKLVLGVSRPADSLVAVTGGSFPSGHAMMTTIFFLCLMYTAHVFIKNKTVRYVLYPVGGILIIVSSYSRLYLHAHWFSDVLAGVLFGVLWFTATLLLFRVVAYFRHAHVLSPTTDF